MLEGTPTRRSLIDSFPFRTMRPSQKEVLDQVEAAISRSKKFVVLEAPVGFGKSAIAATLCRHLESAYLLTSTKQLQGQYSTDFGFRVVTGKSNFTCLVPTSSGKSLPCSKGRCEVDWKLSECPHYLAFEEYEEHERKLCTTGSKCEHLKDRMLCPYYEQKWDAFRAEVMVANYPFFLTELRFTDDIRKRRLLVCDEAHDLEKQMVGSASFTLKRSMLENYRVVDGHGDDAPPAIPDMGLEDASAWKEPLEEAKKALERFLDACLADGTEQDRVASCKDSLESLEGFMEDLGAHPSNWVVNSTSRPRSKKGRRSTRSSSSLWNSGWEPATEPVIQMSEDTKKVSNYLPNPDLFVCNLDSFVSLIDSQLYWISLTDDDLALDILKNGLTKVGAIPPKQSGHSFLLGFAFEDGHSFYVATRDATTLLKIPLGTKEKPEKRWLTFTAIGPNTGKKTMEKNSLLELRGWDDVQAKHWWEVD